MTDPNRTPSSRLLEDLATALRNTAEFDQTSWYDTVEQRVEVLTFDPENPDRAPSDRDPEWRHEEHALGVRIVADPNRYRRVSGQGTPGRLHDFIHSVSDPALQQALWDAAHRGRGAYRRVRDALARRDLEHLWHDFEAAADRALALDWLRSEGLLGGAEDAEE